MKQPSLILSHDREPVREPVSKRQVQGTFLVQLKKCRRMRREGCLEMKIASIWLLGPEDAPTIPFVVKVSLFFC